MKTSRTLIPPRYYTNVTIDYNKVEDGTKWCRENVGTLNLDWHYHTSFPGYEFSFTNEDIALLFLLKFGDTNNE